MDIIVSTSKLCVKECLIRANQQTDVRTLNQAVVQTIVSRQPASAVPAVAFIVLPCSTKKATSFAG
jgi:hypothetical protein